MQTLPQEAVALGAKIENIPNWTAEKLGLPVADLVRSEEEIKEAAQQVTQMAQQQGELPQEVPNA